MENLENINEIDMETSIADDDDFVIKDLNTESAFMDDRPTAPVKTGIILDFNDADEDIQIPKKVISASTDSESPDIKIKNNFNSANFNDSDFNTIDMETYISEDDDFDNFETRSQVEIDNDIDTDLDEGHKKKAETFGTVDKNYLAKLTKRHAATNKKGAYNTAFHFAGNPEKEASIFNHMMGSDSDGEFTSDGGSISISGMTSAEASVGAAGDGGGCCESLNSDLYSKKFAEIADIIGFEIFKNSDGTLTLIDQLDTNNSKDKIAKNIDEAISILTPYIEDCFIYPLQIATGKNFNTCKEWVDWYSPEINKKYPKIKSDIEYCDVIANHLAECEIA